MSGENLTKYLKLEIKRLKKEIKEDKATIKKLIYLIGKNGGKIPKSVQKSLGGKK